MPERFSVSVSPVANDIYRSAVPTPKYLPERRSTAFPHHYTPGPNPNPQAIPRHLPKYQFIDDSKYRHCRHGHSAARILYTARTLMLNVVCA